MLDLLISIVSFIINFIQTGFICLMETVDTIHNVGVWIHNNIFWMF